MKLLHFMFVAFTGTTLTITLAAQQKRPIEPSDCVTVRYPLNGGSSAPSAIQTNDAGTRVAYLVKAPNIQSNRNEIELYIQPVPFPKASKISPLLVGDLSQIHWLSDNRHLMVLSREDGRRIVEEVDITTGEQTTVVADSGDISEYDTDSAGDVVVFATEAPGLVDQIAPLGKTAERGYLVPFQRPGVTVSSHRKLFESHRQEDRWTAPQPIVLTSLFTHKPVLVPAVQDTLFYVSLSPNGKMVLFRYIDDATEIPEVWRKNGFVEYARNQGFSGTVLLALYHLDTKQTTYPFKTPWTSSVPLWSVDNRSFVIGAHAPVGSELEREEVLEHLVEHSSGGALYSVHVDGSKVDRVVPRSQLADPFIPPFRWTRTGQLLIATSIETISKFAEIKDSWREVDRMKMPLKGVNFRNLAVTDEYAIGEFSDAGTPPEIFVWRQGQEHVDSMISLNPQFDGLTLAPVKDVSWTTSSGYKENGYLFLPPGYRVGNRYPLVIQTKPYEGWFACDEGEGHFPSFVPQPLANDGIIYLGISYLQSPEQKSEDYFPQGYPGPRGTGGVAEAVFNMDIFDSAVKELDKRGLIDSRDVGLIGFSRSAWYVEYTLEHSKIPYKAATLADGVHYSLGEYWLLHDAGTLRGWESIYGGPPSGSTLKNWMQYSTSFTFDRIHTPLLMEEMGYGETYIRQQQIPRNLAPHFELLTGLSRLNRPVELYYYPAEGHEPDSPMARLGSLQRNVDWYRFWLQGYERPNPEDAEQYNRWEHLRELRDADGKSSGPPKE